jgi:enamine deaminase RidA (YjgF/YER057c/UK114 family)
MAHMLESASSGLDRIVKMTVVLANSRDFDEMNRVWRQFFPTDPLVSCSAATATASRSSASLSPAKAHPRKATLESSGVAAWI